MFSKLSFFIVYNIIKIDLLNSIYGLIKERANETQALQYKRQKMC